MKKIIRMIPFGVILYIVIGAIFPFINQPKISKETEKQVQETDFTGQNYSGERAYIISDNGEALEERIRMISQAKEEIIFSTFEFRTDESGKRILAALLTAAKKGVKVQLLIDGFSELVRMRGNEYFYALSIMPKVEIRIYNPISLFKPWSMMGRLHDKYIIADSQLYILGGRNTYDYFLGDQSGYKNYDWDFLVYRSKAGQGDSMEQLISYFHSVWDLPECKEFQAANFVLKKASIKKAADELESIYRKMQKECPQWFTSIDYLKITEPVKHIQLVYNPTSYYSKEPVVFYTITELMKNAREEILFHTPYIICNDWMLERLTEVKEEIPAVKMLTNSVANNGNPFGAMDYMQNKEEILDTGIDILEYDGGVSYHGKCFVIDNNLSAIGSFNWDIRSTYIDTELMLIIDSDAINLDLRKRMAVYEKKSMRVIDHKHFIIPEGLEPQTISKKRKYRIKALKLFNNFRFLM